MSFLPDWLTGYDSDNAARAAAADAELRRLNQDRYGRDYVNADDYLGQEAALGAITDSFDEGWQEGRQNVSGFIGGAINKIVADPTARGHRRASLVALGARAGRSGLLPLAPDTTIHPMKKIITWLILPTALVVILALLVHFKKLPVDFWSLSIADKWAALKSLWTPAATTTATTTPVTSTPAGNAALVADQAASTTGTVTAAQAVEIWKLNHPNG